MSKAGRTLASDRALVAAIWLAAAAGLVGGARLMWWYWPGRVFVGSTSDIWTALAWDFAHGEFYRPLLSADGYGGTRYMPLLFVGHGLLMRAGMDPIYSGILLMQTSVLAVAGALYFALRAGGAPARLAAPLSGTVWCTVIFQQYCTDIRADYLAAAFVMLAIGLAARSAASTRASWWLAGAAAACVVAGLTKVTSIAVVAPIVAWLWLAGARGVAWRFAAGTTLLWAATVGLVNRASQGRLVENLVSTASGGTTAADAWGALPHFAREAVSDPFIAAPFALAVWCSVGACRRRVSLAPLLLATTALVTAVIFASPGTVANQLVELHVASALVIGAALTARAVSSRAVAPIYAVLAVAMVAISVPVPGLPSVIGTLRERGPHTRAAVEALHAEFTPPGTRYITNDPIISILANERTVLLDDFAMELSMRRGAPAGRDFEARMRRRDFDVVIFRGADEFPHDMNDGDAGFAEYKEQYWAGWSGHREMAELVASGYDVHAVRKPFVILTRR
ncbi:MAG: hypothetical protein WBD07_17170 [Vicinamibacterales bacterium]